MKQVLLIAGGGTLGTHTARELLRLGHRVDILCPEDKASLHEALTYHKGLGDLATLKELFSKKHYDGIVNFIHYTDMDAYRPIHRLLMENTDHLIFLSSYRVYADLQHPVTETAPHLLDVSEDADFVAREDYAIAKARAERFLRSESAGEQWTIVRPVISFSWRRFDLVTHGFHYPIECAKSGKPILLPESAKLLRAGLDWAGNTGKLIANLLFKKETIGEAYTISTAQNLTWSQVATLYEKLLGAKIQYVSDEEFGSLFHPTPESGWRYWYDRMFDRIIDNRKVLAATGLKKEDFRTIEEGLKIELALYEAGEGENV